MRVLVAGQAKSGTTALYFALKQSLPAHLVGLFEPERLETTGPDVLAKIILGDPMPVQLADFERFDRKILIVRDPRDNLVSRLLYLPFDLPWYKDDDKIAAYGEVLSQKQHFPQSISVLELLKHLSFLSNDDLIGHTIRHHQFCANFCESHTDYFILRYEDFIAGDYAALENFVGHTLTFDGQVSENFAHIARKKGSGDWRNWFTPEDEAFFKPIYAAFIEQQHYDPTWQVNQPQTIEYRSSVEYLRRIIQQRRDLDTRKQISKAQTVLDEIVADREAGLAFLRGEISRLQAQVDEMSHSKFWKLRNYYEAMRHRLGGNVNPAEKVN